MFFTHGANTRSNSRVSLIESEENSGLTSAWTDMLAGNTLLAGLGRSAIDMLVRDATPRALTEGEVLMRQGEPGSIAYFVLSGELRVIVETPLGDVAMSSLTPGQFVGEIAIFSRMPRTATVNAAQPSLVLGISDEVLHTVIRRHPEAAIGLLAMLGRRIAALNQPLALLTLAADAMAQGDADLESMTKLFGPLEAEAPFARSFRRLVVEMERKQSQRQELIVAARLQQSILPQRLDFADHGGAFVAEALMRPSREIGGDFYDMILAPDGRRAVLVVADVSGKGVPAAFFMAISRTLIRSAVLSSGSIEQALERANALLYAENPECLFVTVFMAELEFETGALRYVNAGHCDGYVVRGEGGVLALPANAPALAMLPAPRFTAETVKVGRGDRILLISDGITEAFSPGGEAFGEERLETLLTELKRVPAKAALARIDNAVTSFSAGCDQSDDITCLLVDHL